MGGRWRRVGREALPIIVVVLLVVSARSSLADHYVVPSGSMEYTLLPGDRVLVDKTAYGLRIPLVGWEVIDTNQPRAGEVVVFDSPVDGTRLIKRVVAVGGDLVDLHQGRLRLNGQAMLSADDESLEVFGSHRAYLNLSFGGGPDIAPIEVPQGRLLVIGDARGNSRDGRFFGFIDEEAVYGRAVAVFYRRGEGFTWEPL